MPGGLLKARLYVQLALFRMSNQTTNLPRSIESPVHRHG